jgi:hypothetical protein
MGKDVGVRLRGRWFRVLGLMLYPVLTRRAVVVEKSKRSRKRERERETLKEGCPKAELLVK